MHKPVFISVELIEWKSGWKFMVNLMELLSISDQKVIKNIIPTKNNKYVFDRHVPSIGDDLRRCLFVGIYSSHLPWAAKVITSLRS